MLGTVDQTLMNNTDTLNKPEEKIPYVNICGMILRQRFSSGGVQGETSFDTGDVNLYVHSVEVTYLFNVSVTREEIIYHHPLDSVNSPSIYNWGRYPIDGIFFSNDLYISICGYLSVW